MLGDGGWVHRQCRPDGRPEHHHGRAEVLVALADDQVRFVQKADRARFCRHLGGGHAVQPDGDAPRLRGLTGDRDLAEPMDHRLAVLLRHPEEMAGVAHAADLVDVGKRRQGVRLVEAVHRVGQRRDQQPAGLQVLPRAAQERRAPGAPAEQLQRLHRHEDEREPAVEGEVARVGDHGLDGQPGGAVLERPEERRVDVERDDRRAASRQRKGDPAGAGADVEHRTAGLVGEVMPERKILAVVAALEVVPEDVERCGEIANGAGVHARPSSGHLLRARITRTG